MKNPHTLRRLRELAARCDRTLKNPKVGRTLPDKVYHELVSIPGVEIGAGVPSSELPTTERASIVLELVLLTLFKTELSAAREFGPVVHRMREEVLFAPERVEQGSLPLISTPDDA